MGEFLGKRVIPRHEGDWDKARSYEPLMIVLDPETGDGYISRYYVPAGTLLTNEHYWARCSHFNAQMHRLETDVAEDVNVRRRERGKRTPGGYPPGVPFLLAEGHQSISR